MDKQITLTQEIEIVDDIDKAISEDILLIVQNSNILNFVDAWGHQMLEIDKAGEEYYIKIFRCVNSLIKANALRRNYFRIKDLLLKDLENDKTIKATNIDMLFNKVDAFILIESFFIQIKTSLDLLAQSFQPIYGKEFHTWKHKNNLSGMEIVSTLKNSVKKEIKPHTEQVIELIENNAEAITRIVNHRNDTAHYGKLNKVQGFRYSVSEDRFIPPLILISDNESAYVHEYLEKVLKYISVFVQEVIITLLSNLFNDMIIGKNEDGTWGWIITKDK
jgi:hypothetical protein